MFGNRKGSLSCFNRGSRKSIARLGSVSPRLARHWASKLDTLRSSARRRTNSGCGGAMDQRNANLEVTEVADRAGQNEVKGSQAKNRKHIRRENNERLLGHGKYRGDG